MVEGDPGASHRFSVLGSVLACRGPAFKLRGGGGDGAGVRPLTVRSFDTIYGRYHGSGIASVIAVDSAQASPTETVDWVGQQNLFYGWKGFFAQWRGPDCPGTHSCGVSFHVERERPIQCGDRFGVASAGPSRRVRSR